MPVREGRTVPTAKASGDTAARTVAAWIGILALAASASAAPIERAAGGGGGDGGLATAAAVAPRQIAWSADGLLLAQANQNVVRRLRADGVIELVAGTYVRQPSTVPTPSTPLLPALSTAINAPYAVSVDGREVYHTTDHTIRVVADGLTRVIVDTDVRNPSGLAVADDWLYVSDTSNGRVVRYAIPCGMRCATPTVLASGLTQPKGLAVAADGTIYVAETGANRVRAVRPDGTIFTAAGGGTTLGDGGSASAAKLSAPEAVAIDSADGALYIADTGQHRVRRVSGGIITTVAGTGAGNSVLNFVRASDALAQPITSPSGLAVGGGSLWIASEADARIYRVPLGVGPPSTAAATSTQSPAQTHTATRTATPVPPTATRTASATSTCTATVGPTCFPGCVAVTL